MFAPKLSREGNLFEQKTTDSINKKIENIQTSIANMASYNLPASTDLSDLSVMLSSTSISSTYGSNTYKATIAITENTSFEVNSNDCRIKNLNFKISLSNITYNGSSTSTYSQIDGKMVKIGYVQGRANVDVWFITDKGKGIVHIPRSTSELWVRIEGASELNVYCCFI